MNLNSLNNRWFEKMERNITEENKDKLDSLKGCEVISIKYENCVYINSKCQVIDGGDVVDVLDTNKKIETIWSEYFEQEFGGCDFI